MIARSSRYLLSAGLAIVASSGGAQTPREPAQVQACVRLETQLAALDRGMTDPARADQTKRYEDAVSRQQFELDHMVAQARRTGCEGLGFFLFGGGGQSPHCVELNGQIQRLRAKLDRMMADLQRLQSSGSDRTEQRRAILSALADNDCGPQYRSAQPARPRGFFDSLFGGPGGAAGASTDVPGNPEVPQSSTYRTLCVRTCDGYYYPISFATVPSKFQDDERACQRTCPGAEVTLFTHRNPGEDVSQSVSISGKQPYASLPNAFHYRQELNPSCACRRPGQSWAEALGTYDDTVERGDIIITDEKAKAMAAPKLDSKSARQDPRKAKVDANAPDPIPHPAPAPAAPEGAGKRSIRSVGPQFLPVR